MTEKSMVAIVVCGSAIIVAIVAALAALAIFRDGNDEAVIVAALVSIPSVLISGAAALFGQHLANTAQAGIQQSVASAITPMPVATVEVKPASTSVDNTPATQV